MVDLAGAVEKIQWYTIRWQIEEFHRVLKSGCQAEQRQLETLDRLLRVLALDLVVASKILALSRCARENPGGDPREVLAEAEVEVLRMYFPVPGILLTHRRSSPCLVNPNIPWQ